MQNWKMTTIAECSTILGDGLHGTPKYDEAGEYAFINGNNLDNGHIAIKTDTKRVGRGEYEKYKKALTDRTVLVSINGTLGNVAVYNGEKVILGKSACYFNVAENCDVQFMRYVVSSPRFKQYINSVATGTTIKNVSLKQMREYAFPIPDLTEQKRIARVLYALDQKIDTNRQINDNLQQQAATIYKSWFVDFSSAVECEMVDSEIGKIPRGWRVYRLSEFLPVITGKKNANVSSDKGKYPFFSCSQDFSWTDDYSFEGHAILVAGNGDFNVKWYKGKFEAYQRTYVLIPYEERYTSWLYYAVKYNLARITSAARGSVIKFITKGNLEDFAFAAPSDLYSFEIIDTFAAINRKIDCLTQENYRLAAIRDAILPRLMSGEIDVSDISI